MKDINHLLHRVTQRISINLREQQFDIHSYVEHTIPLGQLVKFDGVAKSQGICSAPHEKGHAFFVASDELSRPSS